MSYRSVGAKVNFSPEQCLHDVVEWIGKFMHRVEAIYDNKDQPQQDITPPNSARSIETI